MDKGDLRFMQKMQPHRSTEQMDGPRLKPSDGVTRVTSLEVSQELTIVSQFRPIEDLARCPLLLGNI